MSYGRRKIFSDATEITAQNVVEEVNAAFQVHTNFRCFLMIFLCKGKLKNGSRKRGGEVLMERSRPLPAYENFYRMGGLHVRPHKTGSCPLRPRPVKFAACTVRATKRCPAHTVCGDSISARI